MVPKIRESSGTCLKLQIPAEVLRIRSIGTNHEVLGIIDHLWYYLRVCFGIVWRLVLSITIILTLFPPPQDCQDADALLRKAMLQKPARIRYLNTCFSRWCSSPPSPWLWIRNCAYHQASMRGTRIFPFHEHLHRRFRFYSSSGSHNEKRWDFQLVPAAEHVPNVFLGPVTQVACYSRLDNSVVKYDNTLLRRFRWPAPGRNLTFGAKLYAAQDASHGNRHSWLKSDVIATCEALSKLIRGVGEFNVSYISGKLYLEAHAWKRKRSTIESYVGFVRLLTMTTVVSIDTVFSGYGFRRAATQLYDPNMLEGYSTPKYPVGVNHFNTVISRTLGGLQLLTSGEIHCVQDGRSGQPNRYIELRCKKDDRKPQ
ncbi:hypothetical protein DFS33DRAFT_635343 [Desarmillaria ectypa]|nr:hypothetical protein DFS33DRAFT_635343 [Desarmillaria ectypa]